MKKKIRGRFYLWLPLVVSLCFAVASLITYTFMNGERSGQMYVQIVAASLVPAILPAISVVSKKDFPPIINILITLHVILASPFGSAMGFYGRFACWDLIMHGYFGFVAAVTLYVLLRQWNGDKLNRFGFFVMIFLGTMGGAALWEIFEYTCDALLGSDAQRVTECLLAGVSPVKDTMTDIIVAIGGVIFFYIFLLIQNKLGKKFAMQFH